MGCNIFTCRHCGEEFRVDEETMDLIENGYVGPPDTCGDCGGEDSSYGPTGHGDTCMSDADPGL